MPSACLPVCLSSCVKCVQVPLAGARELGGGPGTSPELASPSPLFSDSTPVFSLVPSSLLNTYGAREERYCVLRSSERQRSPGERGRDTGRRALQGGAVVLRPEHQEEVETGVCRCECGRGGDLSAEPRCSCWGSTDVTF